MKREHALIAIGILAVLVAVFVTLAIAERNAGDIDCADIGHQVNVTFDDPHELDGDNDGIGCEP